MAAQPRPYYSPEEYLARERTAEHKREYLAGEIFAMAGASQDHNTIAANIVRHLGNQFEGRPCRVYVAVIFEVLSPSTEAYDRGKKFAHYWRLASLADYVLVAQDRVQVDHFARQGSGWFLTGASALDESVYLASIDAALALAAIYANVEFPAPAVAAPPA